MSSFHWVQDWLWKIEGVVPPLCVELVLRDQSRYFLHSVIQKEEETQTGVLRIWDFRAFTDDDFKELKKWLNSLENRSQLAKAEDLFPKIDWANVYVSIDDIAYCIEWHDRLWPAEERPTIGFGKQ